MQNIDGGLVTSHHGSTRRHIDTYMVMPVKRGTEGFWLYARTGIRLPIHLANDVFHIF